RTAAAVVNDGQHRFRGFPLVFLDVVPRSEVQRSFVRSLADRAGPVLALASPRDETTVSFLQSAIGANAKTVGREDSTALNRLREHIFSTSALPENALDTTLEFRSATDEARASVEIASSILFASDPGVPFHTMSI